MDFVRPGKNRFYRLENPDGKIWWIPVKNIKTALEIYQPSGWKGRLLKRLLPYFHNLGVFRKKIGISLESIEIYPAIYQKAEEVFRTNDLEYSIFGGTPSVHQKITIQFFKGKKILGYSKVSDKPEVTDLFFHEQKILERLHEKGVTNIPVCLYCQENREGKVVFFQSTEKTLDSYSPSEWTLLHQYFIENLAARTSQPVKFEDTDLAKSLKNLKEGVKILPDEMQKVISGNLCRVITDYEGTTSNFSAFHADFTPWNMFIQDKKLFVFDWEYAGLSYPPLLDKYHFFVQQMIHVNHLIPKEIFESLSKENWFDKGMFRIYLLDIISRFLTREGGEVSDSLSKILKIWTELLKINEK